MMKTFLVSIGLLLLASCSENKSENLDSNKSTHVVESSKMNEFSKEDLVGIWKVSDVEGKLYVKIADNQPEVEAPLDIWLGKRFEFDGKGWLKIGEENGQEFLSSEYTLDRNGLSIPKYGGNRAMLVTIKGNSMELIQTPENYYSILSEESKIPETQIRKQFRVPGNIIMKLEKQ